MQSDGFEQQEETFGVGSQKKIGRYVLTFFARRTVQNAINFFYFSDT